MLKKLLSNKKTIAYWFFTLWMSLGLTSAGIVQLLRMDFEVEFIVNLGYPIYFLTILGLSKLLGVIAVLIPKFPLLKEWAYAGFVFTMLGAIYSEVVTNSPFSEIFPPILMLILISLSWYLRPASRKTCSKCA